MNRKSWHIDRRTALRGMGILIALPFLESMSIGKENLQKTKRFCSVYFPFGVPLPSEKSEYAEWNWYPKGSKKDFQLRKIMTPLQDMKSDISILKGLSHIKCRKIGGHDTGDSFLTGTPIGLRSNSKNSISLDQVLAEQYGDATRYSSLALGTDGGIGRPSRSHTLSFNASGAPIPALSKPRVIFDRMFSDSNRKKGIQHLYDKKSILDYVLDEAKTLKNKLGKHDQSKLDEYLASIRQVEKQIEREEKWLHKPIPKVDSSVLNLDVDEKMPNKYLRTMYDLLFLSFQMEITRFATFQLASQNGRASVGGLLPLGIGFKGIHHDLAHSAGKGDGDREYGKYLKFLVEHFAYFLKRLKSAGEGDSNMLDNTLVLFGSSNSHTHATNNYPLILAGGDSFGFKHGSFHTFKESVPLSNMFVTILQQMGVNTEIFSESTGSMNELLQS